MAANREGAPQEVMEEQSDEATVELPPELHYCILAYAGRPLLCRLLSRQLSAYGSQQFDRLTIVTAGRTLTIAEATREVRAVASWCAGGLRSLDLRRAEAILDDELVAWLLQALPGLRSLDVSHAGGRLTPSSLALLHARPALTWRAAGCWRMHAPHPSLTAREVLTIQIEALRGNRGSGDGIAQCFAFASPGNRQQTGPVARFGAMLRQSYSVMLTATAARVACVQESNGGEEEEEGGGGGGGGGSLAVFLVSFREKARPPTSDTWLDAMYDAMEEEEDTQGHAVGFLWQLARQRGAQVGNLEGCFMTEGVAPTPVSLEQLCPCLALSEPPPRGEAPLGPLAPPDWKQRVQVWEV